MFLCIYPYSHAGLAYRLLKPSARGCFPPQAKPDTAKLQEPTRTRGFLMYCLRSLILLTLYVFLAASVFAQEPSGPVSDSGFSRVGAVSLESEADDPLKIIYFL